MRFVPILLAALVVLPTVLAVDALPRSYHFTHGWYGFVETDGPTFAVPFAGGHVRTFATAEWEGLIEKWDGGGGRFLLPVPLRPVGILYPYSDPTGLFVPVVGNTPDGIAVAAAGKAPRPVDLPGTVVGIGPGHDGAYFAWGHGPTQAWVAKIVNLDTVVWKTDLPFSTVVDGSFDTAPTVVGLDGGGALRMVRVNQWTGAFETIAGWGPETAAGFVDVRDLGPTWAVLIEENTGPAVGTARVILSSHFRVGSIQFVLDDGEKLIGLMPDFRAGFVVVSHGRKMPQSTLDMSPLIFPSKAIHFRHYTFDLAFQESSSTRDKDIKGIAPVPGHILLTGNDQYGRGIVEYFTAGPPMI